MGKILPIDKYIRKKINVSSILNNDVRRLYTQFSESGFHLLIAGGAVRDLILNQKPNDIDFVTNATPDEVLQKLGSNKEYSIIDHAKKYGCITFVTGSKKYEVTSLRVDIKSFGRAANIEFTNDLHCDAMRRDFSCNSLYLSFDGTVYDPLNAYSDIVSRRVRFNGDAQKRILEDHLRILRYLRFSSSLKSEMMCPDEFEICLKEKTLLLKLSKERIKDELIKLIQSIKSPDIIEKLHLRDFLDLFNIKINDCTHIPKLTSVKEIFNDFFQNPLFELSLALDKSIPVDSIFDSLSAIKFTNNEIKQIKIFLDLINQCNAPITDNIDAYIYKYGREFTRYAIIVSWLIGSKNIQNKFPIKLLNSVSEKIIPNFPIQSTDILELGVKPGKEMGQIIKELENNWLLSNCRLTRSELLEIIGAKLPTDQRR